MAESIVDHADCLPFIRSAFEGKGADVVVSTLPPLVYGPYTTDALMCPHGTTYYLEPTGDQVAKWALESRPS